MPLYILILITLTNDLSLYLFSTASAKALASKVYFLTASAKALAIDIVWRLRALKRSHCS